MTHSVLEALEGRRLLAVDLQFTGIGPTALQRDNAAASIDELALGARPGDTIDVGFVLTNLTGDEIDRDVQVRLFLSEDARLDRSDTLIDTVVVSPGKLTPAQINSSGELSVTLPDADDAFWPGLDRFTLALEARVVGGFGESITINNSNVGEGLDLFTLDADSTPTLTDVFALPINASEISVVWTGLDSRTTSVLLERGVGGSFSTIGTFDAETNQFSDTGLAPGVEVVYRVTPMSDSASGGSLQAAAMPEAFATTKNDAPIQSSVFGSTTLVTTLNGANRPLVLERRFDGSWDVRDLAAEAGGSAVSAATGYVDPTGSIFAGSTGTLTTATSRVFGVTPFTMNEYAHQPDCTWVYTDATIAGSAAGETISGNLTGAIGAAGSYLGRLNAGGDLIVYERNAGGWDATNLSQTLRDQGVNLRAFAGEISAVVTEWNASHFFATDVEGEFWSVWFAPGAAGFEATNLSDISGAPAVVTGSASYIPPMEGSLSGLAVVGTTEAGNAIQLEWSPASDWEFTDLSNDVDSESKPVLNTSFAPAPLVTPWQAFNVLFQDSGNVLRTIWDSPAQQQLSVSNLSTLVGQSPVSSRPVAASATTAFIDAFGFTAGGDVLNISYNVKEGIWSSEVLT